MLKAPVCSGPATNLEGLGHFHISHSPSVRMDWLRAGFLKPRPPSASRLCWDSYWGILMASHQMASILSLVSWTAIPSTQFTLDDSHRARNWGKNKTRLLPRPTWSSLLLWLLPPTPWPISELLLFKGWGPVLLPQNKQDIAKNKDIASSYPFDHLSHTCCTSGSIRVSKRSWHSLSDIC